METATASRSWPAPPMERRDFVSWDDFFAYMEEYQQCTHQTFSRRSATSVKTRNQVLASIAGSGRPLPSPLLPERFLDYTRMLQCSHKLRGEAARPHARWNGEQPSECQARLDEDGKYRIRVTKASLLHNHPLGGGATHISAALSTATASPSQSGVSQETQQTKRRRVGRPRKYYRSDEGEATTRKASTDMTHLPTMADVRAFLERVKRVRSSQRDVLQSVEERLATYVNEFAALEGNAAKIFVDNEKVLSNITLQTKHMRKVFEAFPEVLRVDALPPSKENTSESSYSVFSLMAHDTLGNWQYVQHAIVECDRSETLRAALDQFKAHNARHPRIRALIVPSDDSPGLLEELRTSFPSARVLYSQFHVVRALHKAILNHGNDLTSWHRDRLTGIAQLLVYAPTSLVYGANIALMADVLGSKQHSFFRYYLEMWDSCRDRWTTFAREGVTTFSISENDGQFAPTWREIFAAVNEEMALDETVAAIRYYQTVVERAFIRDLNTELSNASIAAIRSGSGGEEYDAEMRLLAATVSPAASSLVFPQYRYAISRGAYQFFEPTRGSFFVSAVAHNEVFCDDPSKEFCVEAERGWQCSCAFMVNHHLPCRHVFYVRRIIRCSTLIPMEHIEPRWVLTKAKQFFEDKATEIGSDTGPNHEFSNVVPPPGAWQKYVTAQEVGKRISQRMMEMDPVEFDRALRFYKLVESTLNVRPFNLTSAAAARLNIHGGGPGPAARKPNWVEPDPTRTLAPRGGPVAATMSMSPNDQLAAAIAARNRQLAQMGNRQVSQPKTTEVIDLQDESEEEEKNDSGRRATRREGEVGVGGSTGKEAEKQDADKLSENQEPEHEDQNEVSADDLSEEQAAENSSPTSTQRQREPWEAIDGPGVGNDELADTNLHS
ncbi:hypothetical protein, variant 1 [Phytophthora nicotianae]|uniref:SWIM-type domain-containing protein n=2 Tax=Phytophthora nicotianae TaxID=4792 RepID=W2M991_PHYNI|nr:hypothetical protein, variant 1 [Phytophthora nicotianae]